MIRLDRIILFLLFIGSMNLGFAQKPVIYNLVLEGGGMKGMAYPGALMELDKLNKLDSIKRIAGTSSGSVNAALLSIGYTPKQIYKLSYNTSYHKLDKKGFPIFGPIVRMKSTYGWYSSSRFAKKIEEAIEFKTGIADLTFAQLHDSTKVNSSYKDLYITGTCLNQQRTIIFSYETYPNMRIVDAVRISSTLPFHYETLFMAPEGQLIHHKKQTDSTLLMVDGGLMMNYPIHVFDTLMEYGHCQEFIPNPHTLGLRLDEPEQLFVDQGKQLPNFLIINGFNTYMQAFYEMSFEKLNRISMSDTDWLRTISIDSKNIQTKVRKLSDSEKDMLVESGRSAVQLYFETSHFSK
jgi:NTE family protein